MIVLNLVLRAFIVLTVDVLMAVKYILPEPIVLAADLPCNIVSILLLDLLDIFILVELSETFVLHYRFKHAFHNVADTFYRAHFDKKSVILTTLIVMVKNHKGSPV